MANPRTFVFGLALAALLGGGVLVAEEPADQPVLSKHIRDAILAGYRKGPPEPESAAAPAGPALAEVEPGVVALPSLQVTDVSGGWALNREVVTPRTEAVPLVAGTGITEFKGKKYTVLIKRLLFIPIGFKIEW